MTLVGLTLTVDGDLWRTHLRNFAEATPGLVPVAKGNGYGFTLGRLARKAQWLDVDTLAVGTYEELPEVAQRYAGEWDLPLSKPLYQAFDLYMSRR